MLYISVLLLLVILGLNYYLRIHQLQKDNDRLCLLIVDYQLELDKQKNLADSKNKAVSRATRSILAIARITSNRINQQEIQVVHKLLDCTINYIRHGKGWGYREDIDYPFEDKIPSYMKDEIFLSYDCIGEKLGRKKCFKSEINY
jgi:hypothetical protein